MSEPLRNVEVKGGKRTKMAFNLVVAIKDEPDDGKWIWLCQDALNRVAHEAVANEGERLREWVKTVRSKFRLTAASPETHEYWRGYAAAIDDVERALPGTDSTEPEGGIA